MPFDVLRRQWKLLAGLPAVTALAVYLVYRVENPDRIFDATLPIVLGILLGLCFALIVAGARLARAEH
jgi:hypothetical protein